MSLGQIRRRVLLCFGLLGVEMGVWGSRIPEIRLQAGLSYRTLGLALFVLPLATVVSLPFVSLLVGRQGSHRVLRLASVAAPLALIPLGYAGRLLVLVP